MMMIVSWWLCTSVIYYLNSHLFVSNNIRLNSKLGVLGLAALNENISNESASICWISCFYVACLQTVIIGKQCYLVIYQKAAYCHFQWYELKIDYLWMIVHCFIVRVEMEMVMIMVIRKNQKKLKTIRCVLITHFN